MSQKRITNFFPGNDNDNTSDCDTEPMEGVDYYQNLLTMKAIAKEQARIQISHGGAECWKYFGYLQISKKIVLEKYKFCSICFETESTILKGFGVGTSTGNHIKHLKNCHNVDIKSSNFKSNLESTRKALTCTASNSKFNHARRIAEMCCVDLVAFNIAEREGFRNYIKQIDPSVIFPSADTVASTALNDVYDVYHTAVKEILKKSPLDIALVLDMWTDRYKKLAYINIKVHFCEKFELKTVSLKTEIFPHPHNTITISEKVKATLTEFGLQSHKIKSVTDGGSNIVSAMKNLSIERFACLAHTLHLFISSDVLDNKRFEEFRQIILNLKKFFRALSFRGEDIKSIKELENSEILFKKIDEIHQCLEMDENYEIGDLEEELRVAIGSTSTQSLKNSVHTRWNSLLRMIKSFESNFEAINLTLLKTKYHDLIIGDMEKERIVEFRMFLETFEEATTYLQGQKYATMSTWIYFYEKIYRDLVRKEISASFGSSINLYGFAKQHFFRRFAIKKIHVVAALLDPCQKNWTSLENYVRQIPDTRNLPDNFVLENEVENPTTKIKLIAEEIRKRNLDEFPSTSSSCKAPPTKKEKISGARKTMLEFLAGSSGSSGRDHLVVEVEKYFEMDVTETESLEWWREHEGIFPRIGKLAGIYFAIPATSASSEMAFSAAGACITDKRSRLNPTTVKKQLFIHDNYHLVRQQL